MKHDNYDIDDLIGKYLSGEASPEEIYLVETWISKNDGNRKYYDQLKTIFGQAAAITEVQEFDADLAWNRVRQRLKNQNQGKTIKFEPEKKSLLSVYWRVAATIIIVLGIGFFAYRAFTDQATTLQVATAQETKADTLPDGSNVFLNKKTQLAYTFDKKKKAHVVKLKGEAYFNIQHKDEKDFVVQVEDVFIRDIGTSFNVKAWPESNTVEVVVEEGQVMFYTERDSGVMLNANGKGIYNKKTKEFIIDQPEPNVTAYKTRFFTFSDTDLVKVIEEINSVYDQKIVLSPNLGGCRLTATFNNEPLDEIANVIAETFGLTMRLSPQGYLLEGNGCGN